MCPTDRGNDPTVVESDETEGVDRERGTESSNRNGNGPWHDGQWTLVRNPRRAWKKGELQSCMISDICVSRGT
jgi:hypothetical protein